MLHHSVLPAHPELFAHTPNLVHADMVFSLHKPASAAQKRTGCKGTDLGPVPGQTVCLLPAC
jgi:hypothetical protein